MRHRHPISNKNKMKRCRFMVYCYASLFLTSHSVLADGDPYADGIRPGVSFDMIELEFSDTEREDVTLLGALCDRKK